MRLIHAVCTAKPQADDTIPFYAWRRSQVTNRLTMAEASRSSERARGTVYQARGLLPDAKYDGNYQGLFESDVEA